MQYFSASFQFDQIGVQSGVSEQNFAVIQIPDSVLEGDDASQRGLYIITATATGGGIPKYHVG